MIAHSHALVFIVDLEELMAELARIRKRISAFERGAVGPDREVAATAVDELMKAGTRIANARDAIDAAR